MESTTTEWFERCHVNEQRLLLFRQELDVLTRQMTRIERIAPRNALVDTNALHQAIDRQHSLFNYIHSLIQQSSSSNLAQPTGSEQATSSSSPSHPEFADAEFSQPFFHRQNAAVELARPFFRRQTNKAESSTIRLDPNRPKRKHRQSTTLDATMPSRRISGSDQRVGHKPKKANPTKGSNTSQNECEQCGKLYPSSSSLNRHLRVHLGIRPFVCEKCHKRFASRTDVKVHAVVHSPNRVRPHRCQLCDLTFPSASGLEAHQRVHTGELPFECEQCGRRFRYFGNFATHKGDAHGPKQCRTCDECGHVYASKRSLKNHMARGGCQPN